MGDKTLGERVMLLESEVVALWIAVRTLEKVKVVVPKKQGLRVRHENRWVNEGA